MDKKVQPEPARDSMATKSPSHMCELKQIPVAEIIPSRYQTRDATVDVKSLAESIRCEGVLQPILVSPLEDGCFEVVHGHRRLMACQQLGWEKVPCIVETKTEEEKARIVLVENLQRRDLNPIEEARGYKVLREDYSYSVSKITKSIGMSRPHVSNRLRLLGADPSIVDAVSRETLSVAHALLAMAIPPGYDVSRFIDLIETAKPTLRETENWVRGFRAGERMLMFERSVNPKLCRDYLIDGSESPFNCDKIQEMYEEGQKEEVDILGDGLVLRGLDDVKAAQILNWQLIECAIFVPTHYLINPTTTSDQNIFQATDEEWPLILRPLQLLLNQAKP